MDQRTNRYSARRTAGFTLIELMIALAVVAIVTAIAYPNYRLSVLKSHRSEAQAALMQDAQNLERCYTQYGDYTNAGCPTIASSAPGNSTASGYYGISGTVTSSAYTLKATPIGQQTDDKVCTSLSLDSIGNKTATGSDPSKCW